jgi:hypothetical protein
MPPTNVKHVAVELGGCNRDAHGNDASNNATTNRYRPISVVNPNCSYCLFEVEDLIVDSNRRAGGLMDHKSVQREAPVAFEQLIIHK